MWALEGPAVIIIINLVESEPVHCARTTYDVNIGTNEGRSTKHSILEPPRTF
jgi:hypothetical protein